MACRACAEGDGSCTFASGLSGERNVGHVVCGRKRPGVDPSSDEAFVCCPEWSEVNGRTQLWECPKAENGECVAVPDDVRTECSFPCISLPDRTVVSKPAFAVHILISRRPCSRSLSRALPAAGAVADGAGRRNGARRAAFPAATSAYAEAPRGCGGPGSVSRCGREGEGVKVRGKRIPPNRIYVYPR